MKKRMVVFLALILALTMGCVTPTGAARAAANQLSFGGWLSYEAEHFFAKKYPDVELVMNDSIGAEELARRMTTRDEAVDIYIVPADCAFTSIKEKGLAALLSGSEIIAADVAAMDESVRHVITDANGQIVAYPCELSLWYYGINAGYWHMLWPDRPLPETFEEVLDAWIEWERDYAQDYPGVGFIGWEFDYADLVRDFIETYVMQHDGSTPPDLQAESLRVVLEKLAEVRDIRVERNRPVDGEEDPQLASDSETGPGAIFRRSTSEPMWDDNSPSVRMAGDYMYGLEKGNMTELPLAFEKGALAHTDARLEVYLVNPYSRHLTEALAFIECMTDIDAETRLYYALHPDCNTPYENAGYENRYAEYIRQRDMYKTAIERAQEAGTDWADLEGPFNYYEDWLNYEDGSYLISETTIDQYRRMVEAAPLDTHSDSPYVCADGTTAGDTMLTACRQYASGEKSLDAFLKELEAKMNMIYQENK